MEYRPDQHTLNDLKPVTDDCAARWTEKRDMGHSLRQKHPQAWPSRCSKELAGALRHEEPEQLVGQHIVLKKKKKKCGLLQAFGAHHNDFPLCYGLL